MIGSCKIESYDSKNQTIVEKWKKPASVAPPAGRDRNSKDVRTYVYWNDLRNLIDSMYVIPLNGNNTKNLSEVGGTVCGMVAEEINKLPTENVDEEAINTGQKAYATLLKARNFYSDWGQLTEGIKSDPGSLSANNPVRSAEAGFTAVQKQEALEQETQIELSRVRALLNSRYKGLEFPIPHEFN
jgi:hypothetical protein